MMEVKTEYTPTIMDGAVIRFKIDDRYQINASRNGVSAHGTCPIMTDISEITTINNLFLAGWSAYTQMKANPRDAHDIAKAFVKQMAENEARVLTS